MVLIAVEQIHSHSSIADLQITVHGIWQYELDPLVKQVLVVCFSSVVRGGEGADDVSAGSAFVCE